MKWITKHEYIDLDTGEITDKVKETIIIIKKKKKHAKVQGRDVGVTTVTNYYRTAKYKPQQFNFYTTEHTTSGKTKS